MGVVEFAEAQASPVEKAGNVKVLFLDESGSHDLKTINPAYPVFVLGGAIVERSHLRSTIQPEMREFKLRHFGRTDVVLHTVQMGKGRGDYAFLADPVKRAAFYDELNHLLQRWDYKVLACVFEMTRYVAQYHQPADPYHHGLEMLIERYCRELRMEEDAGLIPAEKRNPRLDLELVKAWEAYRSAGGGTGYVGSDDIDKVIVDLSLKDKMPESAGLQLADLVVTPPGRQVAGYRPKPDQVQWSVVESKLRRGPGGSYEGYGLVIRPKAN